MKKEIKRIIRTSNKTIFMFFIGVMLLILVFFPSHANASNRTIKVGWQISKGFQELDDFGNCTGYNFEYLSKISQYTGWNYEFVHGDLSELLSKIEKGEIDLLGGVAFTEERTEKFVYNSYSTFSSFLVLLAKVDNSELNFGHFSALNNKKVGILDTGVRDEAFDSLAKNNNFSSNLIVTTSDSEALEKVKSGELDATLVNMNAMTPDFKVIAMLSPRDFYFVVPKGKEQIALELDKAISYIKILEPDFEDSVFSKYFSIGESQNFLFFDNEEKKFIDENPSINAYSVEDLEPLMYRSQKNGDLSGFLYDYTNLAIGKTGLNLTYYTEKNLSSLIEKYDSDPKGILVFAPLDFDWAEKHNSFITQSFFSLPSVFLLTRKHSGDVKKVGVLVNNLITVNKPTNDKYDFRKFDSTKDALLALRKGGMIKSKQRCLSKRSHELK